MTTLATMAETPHLVFDRILAAASAPAVASVDPGFILWLEDRKPAIVKLIAQTAARLDREARGHWRQMMLAVQDALKAQTFPEGNPHHITAKQAQDILYALSGEYQAPGGRNVYPKDFGDLPDALRTLMQDVFADPRTERPTIAYFEANSNRQLNRLFGLLAGAVRKDLPATIKYTTAPVDYDYSRDVETLEMFLIDDGVNDKPWRKVALYDSVSPQINRWHSGNHAVQDEDPRIFAQRMEVERKRWAREAEYAKSQKGRMEAITTVTEFDRRKASGEFDRLRWEDVAAARRKVEETETTAHAEREFQEARAELAKEVPPGSTVIEYAASAGHIYDVNAVYTDVQLPTSRWTPQLRGMMHTAKGKPRLASFGPTSSRDRPWEVYTGNIPPAVLAKSNDPAEVKPLPTSQGTVYWIPGRYGASGTLLHANGRTIAVTQKLYSEALYGPASVRLAAAQIPDPDGVHYWLTDGHALYRNDALPADWPSVDLVKTGLTWAQVSRILDVARRRELVAYHPTGKAQTRTDQVSAGVWTPVAGEGKPIWLGVKLSADLRRQAHTVLGAPHYDLQPVVGLNTAGELIAMVMPMRQD